MPIINIEGPQIDLDTKRTLAQELTDAACKAYGLPRETIIVLIRENEPDKVSVGGELICDRS